MSYGVQFETFPIFLLFKYNRKKKTYFVFKRLPFYRKIDTYKCTSSCIQRRQHKSFRLWRKLRNSVLKDNIIREPLYLPSRIALSYLHHERALTIIGKIILRVMRYFEHLYLYGCSMFQSWPNAKFDIITVPRMLWIKGNYVIYKPSVTFSTSNWIT